MPLTDTLANTSFGAALSATGATSGLAIGDDEAARSIDCCVLIVASSVTSGATFFVERKNAGGAWRPIAKFAITEDGSYAIPAWGGKENRSGADPQTNIRVNCVARTDGSYACSLSKLTKA